MTMTGPAPTTLRRVVASATALLALTTAFAVGYLVAGDRRDDPSSYRLAAAGLDSGLSCDRLLQWYVGHGLDQVTAWGWQGQMYRELGAGVAVPDAPAEAPGPASGPNSSLDTRTGSSTGTNVQEAGVDEPDIAKVSGDLLVRITDGALKTDDLSGAVPRRLGVAPLDPIGDPQLLLAGDRAVVIGSEIPDPAAGASPYPSRLGTWVRTYDLSDPSDPTLVDSRLYDGSLLTARQIGSTVRLVLEGGLPSLPFEMPSETVSQQQALTHNRQVVRESTIEDWLPQVSTYDTSSGLAEGSSALLGCDAVAVPEAFDGLGTLGVVGFDPSRPGTTSATAVTTSSETAYMSTSHLYVATSPWSQMPLGGPVAYPQVSGGPTRIYGFDLAGAGATYIGMGTVDGTVSGSWSMDEYDGVLRVATTSSSTSSDTSVVLLRPETGRLLDVGRVDGLGVGQTLKSVRWFDDLAVVVTYQQVDPFYVVDLADPTRPRVLGELHLPGWSSYLHPVGPHLVLGLGQDVTGGVVEPPMPQTPQTEPMKPAPSSPDDSGAGAAGGSAVSGSGSAGPAATAEPEPVDPPNIPVFRPGRAKATLFDITDPAHPREVDTVTYRRADTAMAGMQPHQVTWLPDQHVLLTVLSGTPAGGWTPPTVKPVPAAWVSVLTVHHGSLANRMVAVPDATDVNTVRTLPLSGGRVVLVAGDSVRFVSV